MSQSNEHQQQQSQQQNEEAQQQQGQHIHKEEEPVETRLKTTSRQRQPRSQTMWPTDVMSVGEVNYEDVPLDMTVNTRLSRICGLAARQMMSITLQGFDDLTENKKDELFENSIQAYVQYSKELKQKE
jgi:hypothetical protein